MVDRKTDKEVWLGTMTSSIGPGASPSDIAGVVAQTLGDFSGASALTRGAPLVHR